MSGNLNDSVGGGASAGGFKVKCNNSDNIVSAIKASDGKRVGGRRRWRERRRGGILGRAGESELKVKQKEAALGRESLMVAEHAGVELGEGGFLVGTEGALVDDGGEGVGNPGSEALLRSVRPCVWVAKRSFVLQHSLDL